MKALKKWGAALLVLALCLVPSMSLSAADGDKTATGIELDKDGSGAIIIHKRNLTDVDYDNLKDGTGEELAAGDTISKTGNTTLGDTKPLGGITFTIEKMKWEATAKDWVQDPLWTGYTGATPVTGETAIYQATTDDTNGEVKFEGLKFGTYQITELAKDGVTVKDNPILIAVPTLLEKNGSNDEWLYKVHVYPKNKLDPNELEKKYEEKDEGGKSHGNKIPWTYSYAIPKTVTDDGNSSLVITDILKDPLEFKDTDAGLKAWVTDDKGDATDLSIATSGTPDILVTYTAPDKLTFTVQTTGFTAMKAALVATSPATPVEPKLHIKFNTFTNVPADKITPDPEALNGGTIEYEDPNDKIKFEIEELTKAPLGNLDLTKDGTNKEAANIALVGVEFMLYGSESDANTGANPISVNGSTTFVTKAGGKLNINGLQYGDYWLVETKTTGNYNLLTHPIKFTISDSNKTHEVTVENHEGFTLPPTGGNGTLIFTVVGLSLITVAGVIFILYRRRHRRENDAT